MTIAIHSSFLHSTPSWYVRQKWVTSPFMKFWKAPQISFPSHTPINFHFVPLNPESHLCLKCYRIACQQISSIFFIAQLYHTRAHNPQRPKSKISFFVILWKMCNDKCDDISLYSCYLQTRWQLNRGKWKWHFGACALQHSHQESK